MVLINVIKMQTAQILKQVISVPVALVTREMVAHAMTSTSVHQLIGIDVIEMQNVLIPSVAIHALVKMVTQVQAFVFNGVMIRLHFCLFFHSFPFFLKR